MATGPNPPSSGQKQLGRTSGGEGAYFEGEGHQPFEERGGDADSREAEAVVDDLISEFTGGGSPTPASQLGGAASTSPPTGKAPGSAASGTPEGSAATGTGRGSDSDVPAGGRMG